MKSTYFQDLSDIFLNVKKLKLETFMTFPKYVENFVKIN